MNTERDTTKGQVVMDRFNKLSRGLQMMLVGSVLLLIVSFFDWQAIDDFPGISAWNGFWGVVMGLLTIVLLAWLVARLAAVDIPVPVSLTGAVLAFLIFLCALLKNLTDDYSTIWSYIGLAFAALIAVGAWLQVQEAGGVDNLKSEIPNMSSSGAATAPPAASVPPEPAAPAAPPPPAPEPDVTPDDRPESERT